MKFLLLSDLHYALKQFDWAAAQAENFDLVVLAGDHLDISSTLDGRVQIVVILKYLRKLKDRTRVIVSSGNHDLDATNGAGEKYAKWMSKVRSLGIATDGDSFEIDDTLFTVCPWWDGPSTRDAVGALFTRDAEKKKDKWVWVYHSPPADSPTSWSGQKHFGDTDLVGWIGRFQPSMVMTGHIHQSPFASGGSWVDRLGSTWVFNSGRQIGPTPAHVIVNTDLQSAVWLSLAGGEMVDLGEPLQRPVKELTALPDWLLPPDQMDLSGSRSEPGVNSSS